MAVPAISEVPQQCKHLAEPSLPQFAVSCALMGWLLICYVPQWKRIVSRASAEGLSTLYILLGSVSGVCAVGNIMMIPSSAVEIGCCRTNTRFACISSLLGMMQVILGIACFWVVLFMYVYYSEEEAEAELHGRRPSISGPNRTRRRARRAWIILLAACTFAFAILLISSIILHRFPWYSQAWADILGVLVTIFACIQWIPQTWTTWHLGHLGSLSLTGLYLQAPYTWIFCVNMMIRVGLEAWSVWTVYLLVGTMQLILIGMGIFFAIRDRKESDEGKSTAVHEEDFESWNAYVRSRAPSNVSQAPSNLAPDERSLLLPRKRASDAR
ncbi:hypothetical protein B0A55_02515 [Friedmanniomyces simplex]|uniref:PQ loop repeat protein n=1 Tax=Friedmanniomyces simplex TaxID=329884 RepID=A0A4U0XNT9_9PEZI|nr:hypothetical protein B0A55_02515 [Friedmanniomyces simplex]